MPDLYEELIEAAHDLFGAHERSRALHAKGAWCEAVFTASPEASELSRAAIFQGSPVPALVRFSNGSGKPDSNDAARDARGMAVKLRPEGAEETDIVTVTTPCFVTRTADEFLELLRLRRPDPATGEPDMEKLGAFLGAHPESMTAIQFSLTAEPPASFAQLTYFSPHTYRLVGAGGDGTWVRFRWVPEAGEAHLSDEEAAERGRDYLRPELEERLGKGPVGFDLVVQIPEEGDPIEDPTAVWPDDRRTLVAGRLEITSVVDDPERDGHIDVFDPTRVADGVELSGDPVLTARARAYSVSAYARWDRPDGDGA
jgi:catalase